MRIYLVLILIASAYACGSKVAPKPEVRLYAIDCGTIEVSDIAPFDDKGRLDRKSEVLANPCFLIKHGERYMIWDTGHPSSIADLPDGVGGGGFHSKLETKLPDRLAKINLKPLDIDFLALSHHHPDHAGNANLFSSATWLAVSAERDHMFSDDLRRNPDFFDNYSELEDAKIESADEIHDVFGNGSVVMFSTPGHTPGHSVLLVRLRNAGSILLTGDLFTHSKAREMGTIPKFTMDKKQLVESRKRFEEIAKKEDARVITQHSKKDFDSLPKFPAYLD
ncbi:MAG: N-acyl homoserine lactonase family protein [Pyrinomonadaceae bacterium]|nr:N-acyl homoserine lactonase family protein [Pyrinomonadaceae bacterium]